MPRYGLVIKHDFDLFGNMIRVSIPSYHKVVEENSDSYTVFTIEVCIIATGKTTSIQKRYSEFEMLHKQLKKQMKTPEFPPKKVLKFSNKVLEHRRLALQTYIQGVVLLDKIPKALFHFLDVEQYIYGSQESLDQIDSSNKTTHQPVIAFAPEAYLQDSNRNGSWDIVNAGVLAALYNHGEDLVVR
ncbi:sorting nexin-24-like [Ostrea edulis]|uniref:sorting nexin-24-like n=1 Tax=Ostrea edulis TaxID=37623 RepID=UPI0024AFEA92|nr:sorting nexin-24-like [Ostrea edulis]